MKHERICHPLIIRWLYDVCVCVCVASWMVVLEPKNIVVWNMQNFCSIPATVTSRYQVPLSGWAQMVFFAGSVELFQYVAWSKSRFL